MKKQPPKKAPFAKKSTPAKRPPIKTKTPSGKYTSIQCIAWEIATTPLKDHYVGILPNANDIQLRLQLLEKAAGQALQHPDVDPSTDVLKLFMLPEFFFRGKEGAYTMDDVQTVIESLQQFAGDSTWSDWLFVFGTIVGYSIPNSSDPYYALISATKNIPIQNLRETYNFSYIQGGGYGTNPAAAQAYSTMILKENLSGIDFVPVDLNGIDMTRANYIPPVLPAGIGSEEQVVNYDGLCVFKMFNTLFGGEICLDHSEQRIAKSLVLPGASLLQVQLVPSCGMNIKGYATCLVNGGIIFNVDGYADNTNYDVHSAVRVEGGASPISTSEDVNAGAIPVNTIFGYGAGELSIYSTCKLPKSDSPRKGFLKTLEYNEEPFNLVLEVMYDANMKFDSAMLSGTVSTANAQLLAEKLPINSMSNENLLKCTARVARGNFEMDGKPYDLAVEINLLCGNAHVNGFIMPFMSVYSG